MLYTVIVSGIVSIICSIAVWRFFINWQFHRSTAGMRLLLVSECTQVLFAEEAVDPDIDIEEFLSSRYRNSMGLIIARLWSFWNTDQHPTTNSYPKMYEEHAGDAWNFYEKHVRQVVIDINNNSFIGWLPGFPLVRKLLALQAICFQLEKVASCIYALHQKENNSEVALIENSMVGFTIQQLHGVRDCKVAAELVHECRLLKKCWNKWIDNFG